MDRGSTQHSRRAHGEMRRTSGGSTPIFKHKASATAVVFVRSFWRQRETGGAPGVEEGVARMFEEYEFHEEATAAEVSCRACENRKRGGRKRGEDEFGLFFLRPCFFPPSPRISNSFSGSKLLPRKSRPPEISTAGTQIHHRCRCWSEREAHRSWRRRRACSGRTGRRGRPSSSLKVTAPPPPMHPSSFA